MRRSIKLKKRVRAKLKMEFESNPRKAPFLLSTITSFFGTLCPIITCLSPTKPFNLVYDFYILTILTIIFPFSPADGVAMLKYFHDDDSSKAHPFFAFIPFER